MELIMSNIINGPLFTTAVLVRDDLDLTLKEWQNMPLPIFIQKAEELRQYIVNNVLTSGHNFFTGNLTIEEINEKLRKIKDFDRTIYIPKPISSKVLDRKFQWGSGIITYNGQLTRAINHWFPEIAFAKNSKGVSIVDQFYDKDQFYTNFHALIMKDRFKFLEEYGDKSLSKKIKSGLSLVNGNQPMQNFPAGVAKWIINNSLKKKIETANEFNILDNCAGWGGRLVGGLAACSHDRFSGKTFNYFTTEVNSKIYNRYAMLVGYWNENIQAIPNFNLIMPDEPTPFEDILEDKIMLGREGTFDLALVSPPYYNREKYSDDENQSFIKFGTYEEWRKGFLVPLLKNTYILLKSGGEFYLNISDINGANGKVEYNLVSDSVEIAENIGFTFHKKYLIEMPTHGNFNKDIINNEKVQIRDGKRHKYEPLLVFVK